MHNNFLALVEMKFNPENSGTHRWVSDLSEQTAQSPIYYVPLFFITLNSTPSIFPHNNFAQLQ